MSIHLQRRKAAANQLASLITCNQGSTKQTLGRLLLRRQLAVFRLFHAEIHHSKQEEDLIHQQILQIRPKFTQVETAQVQTIVVGFHHLRAPRAEFQDLAKIGETMDSKRPIPTSLEEVTKETSQAVIDNRYRSTFRIMTLMRAAVLCHPTVLLLGVISRRHHNRSSVYKCSPKAQSGPK